MYQRGKKKKRQNSEKKNRGTGKSVEAFPAGKGGKRAQRPEQIISGKIEKAGPGNPVIP